MILYYCCGFYLLSEYLVVYCELACVWFLLVVDLLWFKVLVILWMLVVMMIVTFCSFGCGFIVGYVWLVWLVWGILFVPLCFGWFGCDGLFVADLNVDVFDFELSLVLFICFLVLVF